MPAGEATGGRDRLETRRSKTRKGCIKYRCQQDRRHIVVPAYYKKMNVERKCETLRSCKSSPDRGYAERAK